ncbi:MAG: hypothetical protein RLY91_372 [Pseudomonadota bacterium]|jgi:uncharacterized membrane protein (UPF0127 family)
MCKWLCLSRQRGLRVALFSLLVTLTTVASLPFASAQPIAPLPVKQLTAGMHVIRAEVASNNETRSRGLMYRKELAPNGGMLFVFEQPAVQCFWMRNTLIPLSIAFMTDDGTITNIADMAPMTENSHCSSAPVRLALEMEQGWFAKRGITAGKKIGGLQ